MKCPACGRDNRPSAGFCAFCGVSLKATEPPAPAPLPTEAATEAQGAQEATPEVPAAPEVAEVAEPLAVSEQAPVVPAEGAAEERATLAVEAGPPKPGTPLRPGDVLAERYEILEVLESTPERNRYRADDRRRCALCGNDDNMPTDEFCRECGASLAAPAYVTIVELVQQPPEEYDLHFVEADHDFFVKAEPLPAAPSRASTERPEPSPLKLIWGRATDKGLQRDLNEDYLETWLYARGSGGVLGLFVVADGLGGQDSGEVASRMATNVVWQNLRESVWEPIVRGEAPDPDTLEKRLAEAVAAANKAVYEARLARNSEMNTTLTLALVVNDVAYVGNVGDSRTYLWNAQGLRRITKDHSLVQRLVDTGQIAPQDVYRHPNRNLIYQSIGDRAEVKVDTFRHRLQPDDRLILCSDGLWEMVRDEGLEEVLLAEPDPQRACEQLVRNANLAGGEDNITVIIVQAIGA